MDLNYIRNRIRNIVNTLQWFVTVVDRSCVRIGVMESFQKDIVRGCPIFGSNLGSTQDLVSKRV